tara:strand:+ start:20841 stop:23885 length:3045 start_codon:yes stop_codon:yes gene_type:complete
MINSDHGRRVFCLQISGLKYRYHSINPPASSNLDSEIVSGISYVDIQAINKVGSFQSSIDPAGGIASYSPISIDLSFLKDGSTYDPGILFNRVGKRAASVAQANLEENINFDPLPQTINIDKDLTSLSTPRIMHVGGESFKISSFTSSSMTISDRAIGDSIYQDHDISLQGSFTPIVTSEIVSFRGRRAKLFIAHKDQSGLVSDYTEIINGFIESSPYSEGENSVSINILPLVSLIDGPLADTKSGVSFLKQGFHYFHDKSNVLEFGSAFKSDYTMIFSSAEEYPTPGAPSSKSKIYIQYPSYDLDKIFDESRNKGIGFINSHPRYPYLIIDSLYKAYPSSLGINSTVPYIIIDHTITGSILQNTLLSLFSTSPSNQVIGSIPKRGEIKRILLGQNEVKQFPEVINEKMSSLGPQSLDGTEGAFHSFRINGSNIIGIPLADQRGWSPGHEGRLHFWLSSSWYESSPNFNYACWINDNIEDRSPLSNEYRLFYPLDYWNNESPPKPNYASNSRKIKVLEFPNRRAESIQDQINIALAYHQANEKTILVESSLNLPTSLTPNVFYAIQVQTYDYETKRSKVLHYRATHEQSISLNGVQVGYLIHIPAIRENLNNGHFGDWKDEARTQITRGVSAFYISPGEMMLQILQSGGGGNNGNYDLLGVGLSIHESNIDIDSFLINGSIQSLGINTSFSVDDFDCREFIESLLKSISCIIIMKRSSAGSKITLQPVGIESNRFVSSALSNNELLTTPAPNFSIYEDIVTQVKIQFGWNNEENKFTQKVTFNNQEAINRYGGEKSSISIDLYGLNSEDIGGTPGDAYDYLLPIAARIFNTMSNPNIEWSLSIGTGKSIFLDVGSYIKVSSPHLKGYQDSYGVSDSIGMIKSINQNLMNEGSELKIVHTGISFVNWNSALKVTFVTSNISLTVSNNTYSDNDTSFFKAGDIVDFLPFGDEDNSINSLEILSIINNIVTFTAVHNIITLGTIEPSSYTLATSNHKADAYLSNLGLIGADQAQEYA